MDNLGLQMRNLSKLLIRLMVCKRKHVLSLSMEKNMEDIGLQKGYLSWKMLSKLLISNILRKKVQGTFCLDHSNCHGTFADNALDASKMNLKPGGKQPRMHDTIWNGKVQKMVFEDGTPKGHRIILIERGVNVTKMKLDDMRALISMHADFCDEQPEIIKFLRGSGFGCIFYLSSIVNLIQLRNVGHRRSVTCVHTRTIQFSD